MVYSESVDEVIGPGRAKAGPGTMPETFSSDRQGLRWDWAWAVLLILPILVMQCDRGWLFGNCPCDRWFYFGYYIDLAQHLQNFSNLYYSSRLSTILVGWLFYKILPALHANYALHLGLYYVCVFALYAVLRQIVGRRAALLAAMGMGCHFHFLQEIGSDYVDSFGMAYCMLTLWCLTRAARSPRWRLALAGAGASFIALVVAYPTFGMLAPGLLATYFIDNGRQRKNPILLSVAFFTIGSLSLFCLLTVVNALINGNYWFLRPTFMMVKGCYSSSAELQTYRLPTSDWLPHANHLVFPAIVLLGMVPALWRSRRQGNSAHWITMAAFQSQLALTVILLGLCEFWLCPATLIFFRYPIYTSVLIPATFLALGCQLPLLLDRLNARQFAAVTVALLSFMLYPMLSSAMRVKLPQTLVEPLMVRCHFPPETSALFWSLVLGMTAMVLLWLSWRGVVKACLFVMILGVCEQQAFPCRQVRNAGPCRPQDNLQMMADAMEAAQRVDPRSQTYLWYDAQEPFGCCYNAQACTFLWGARLVNTRFPAVTKLDAPPAPPMVESRFCHPLREGLKVAILSCNGGALARANAALGQVNLGAVLLTETALQRGCIAYKMTFVQIVAK